MLFIGYPITYQTAAKLIGLHPDTNHDAIADKYKQHQLALHYIYQNTCALGITIYDLTPQSDSFHEFDDGLEIIMVYKRSLMGRIQRANIDITSLEIVPSRDAEPITKTNPQPYIIII